MAEDSAGTAVTVPLPDAVHETLDELDDVDFLDDVEFVLDEVESKIAPLALAYLPETH